MSTTNTNCIFSTVVALKNGIGQDFAVSLTTSKMKNDSISVVNIHANTTFETIIKDPNQKSFLISVLQL